MQARLLVLLQLFLMWFSALLDKPRHIKPSSMISSVCKILEFFSKIEAS